jgi:hypothetical protein
MRIKKVRPPQDKEIASTIVVRAVGDGRQYWTGEGWADDLGKAKRYLQSEALRKAQKKSGKSFTITLGFSPK